MNAIAVIATHHKTGTEWMWTTFEAICSALDIPFVGTRKGKLTLPNPLEAPAVVFAHHARLMEIPQRRVFHLFRDPRDVVISCMRYHLDAGARYLHRPLPEFGNLTYQQKLKSLPDDKARYLFEMDNRAGTVTRQMRRWNYGLPETFECRYEDLIADVDMTLFTKVLKHLGFADRELDECRGVFWRLSLFGEGAAHGGHVRSGEARQWPRIFDAELGAAFVERFGNVLIELGYEADNSWVHGLNGKPAAVA